MTDADKIRTTYNNGHQLGVKYPEIYRMPVQVPLSVTLNDGAVTAQCCDIVEIFQHKNGFVECGKPIRWVEVYGRLRDSTVMLDNNCPVPGRVRLQYTKTLERNTK